MTRYIALLSLAFSMASLCAADAPGQLFGQRSLGQPVSQRAGAATSRAKTSRNPAVSSRSTGTATGTAPAAGGNRPATESRGGLVNENARFIRGNRDASDFVGAAGRDDQQFVGRQEAGVTAEEIRSAVDELQIQTGPDANQTAQPAMPPRVRMYAPRLRVAFDFVPTADSEVSSRLTRCLASALPAESSSRIEVSAAGDAAILRGAVASERERKLAELLLKFEPGIARVQNQLRVQPVGMPLPPPAVQATSPD